MTGSLRLVAVAGLLTCVVWSSPVRAQHTSPTPPMEVTEEGLVGETMVETPGEESPPTAHSPHPVPEEEAADASGPADEPDIPRSLTAPTVTAPHHDVPSSAVDGAVPPPPGADRGTPAMADEPRLSLARVWLEDEVYPEPDPVLRLHHWLEVNRDRAYTMRISLAVLGLVLGATAVGGAVWALTESEEGHGALGSIFVLTAVSQLSLGVAMLHLTLPQEDRFARWLAVRRVGASPTDVAAFAGEFRSEADAQRSARTIAAILGFSLAAGGAAALTLGAASDLGTTDRLVTMTVGVGFAAAGTVMGLLALLVESQVERDFRRYERGLAPRTTAFAPRLYPSVSRGGAGLVFGAVF